MRVCVQVGDGDAALVLVATPGRLCVFLGGPGLQGAFSGYSSRSLGEADGSCGILIPAGEPGIPTKEVSCRQKQHEKGGVKWKQPFWGFVWQILGASAAW